MFRRRRGKWLTVTLLIAALAGVIGHICVVPLHAHAVPVEGHGSHDDDAADHSVHTASCEAAKNCISANALMPPAQPVALEGIVALPLRLSHCDRAADVLTAESPPLFVLHASLLI